MIRVSHALVWFVSLASVVGFGPEQMLRLIDWDCSPCSCCVWEDLHCNLTECAPLDQATSVTFKRFPLSEQDVGFRGQLGC